MQISKSLYHNRDSGMRLDVIAQATDILNYTNFSFVNNNFPNTYQPGATSAIVSTGEGDIDLLNGPFHHKGYVPRSATDSTAPLAFGGANPPRQISFALRFAF
jgi:hypothetical protein